jgi:hypothetical protein
MQLGLGCLGGVLLIGAPPLKTEGFFFSGSRTAMLLIGSGVDSFKRSINLTMNMSCVYYE